MQIYANEGGAVRTRAGVPQPGPHHPPCRRAQRPSLEQFNAIPGLSSVSAGREISSIELQICR